MANVENLIWVPAGLMNMTVENRVWEISELIYKATHKDEE